VFLESHISKFDDMVSAKFFNQAPLQFVVQHCYRLAVMIIAASYSAWESIHMGVMRQMASVSIEGEMIP